LLVHLYVFERWLVYDAGSKGIERPQFCVVPYALAMRISKTPPPNLPDMEDKLDKRTSLMQSLFKGSILDTMSATFKDDQTVVDDLCAFFYVIKDGLIKLQMARVLNGEAGPNYDLNNYEISVKSNLYNEYLKSERLKQRAPESNEWLKISLQKKGSTSEYEESFSHSQRPNAKDIYVRPIVNCFMYLYALDAGRFHRIAEDLATVKTQIAIPGSPLQQFWSLLKKTLIAEYAQKLSSELVSIYVDTASLKWLAETYRYERDIFYNVINYISLPPYS